MAKKVKRAYTKQAKAAPPVDQGADIDTNTVKKGDVISTGTPVGH